MALSTHVPMGHTSKVQTKVGVSLDMGAEQDTNTGNKRGNTMGPPSQAEGGAWKSRGTVFSSCQYMLHVLTNHCCPHFTGEEHENN